jgi:hypothetical protein
MLAILLTLAAQAAPPRPDPWEPSWTEAAAIFRDSPIPEKTQQAGIEDAVWWATSEAMRKSASRYDSEKSARLRHTIAAHVPADLGELNEEVARCATKEIAYKLGLDEIRQVRQSLQTTAGRKFWEVVSYPVVVGCYRSHLLAGATDADYIASGLKPPRRVKLKLDRGNSVS